jgi:hypothetical protein
MNIEVLYFEGCPSYAGLMGRLRDLVAEAGLDPESIRTCAVQTVEAAHERRFLGSPSVRVDGRDVEPASAAREDYGITCRLYRSEGRSSPVPADTWIRDALAHAGR